MSGIKCIEFISEEKARFVASVCYKADRGCRSKLVRNGIVKEDDYVSILTDRIELAFQSYFGIRVLSQTLAGTYEQAHGVDGILVFRDGSKIKTGLFEAKWPRLKEEKRDNWDYMQKGESHFSSQIKRQHKWQGQLAVWEMFINEGAFGFQSPPWDYYGSSCVWHKDAHAFMLAEDLATNQWTKPKLDELLRKKRLNLYKVVYAILSCREGVPFDIDPLTSRGRVTSIAEPEAFMDIPIPQEFGANVRDDQVDGFMREQGFNSFIYVDLNQRR